jgi:hypothetical protein
MPSSSRKEKRPGSSHKKQKRNAAPPVADIWDDVTLTSQDLDALMSRAEELVRMNQPILAAATSEPPFMPPHKMMPPPPPPPPTPEPTVEKKAEPDLKLVETINFGKMCGDCQNTHKDRKRWRRRDWLYYSSHRKCEECWKGDVSNGIDSTYVACPTCYQRFQTENRKSYQRRKFYYTPMQLCPLCIGRNFQSHQNRI